MDAIEAPDFVLWVGGTAIAIGVTLIAGACSPASTKLPTDQGGARRFLRRMVQPGVPDPWPKGAERCPACGRSIPGGIRPQVYMSPLAGPVTLNPPLAADALIRLCPIDGELKRRAKPSGASAEEVEAYVVQVVDLLVRAGEDSWAHMLRRCLDDHSDGDKLTYMGHALAILVHRAVPLIAPLHPEQRRLEQMLVDTVQLWPTGRAT